MRICLKKSLFLIIPILFLGCKKNLSEKEEKVVYPYTLRAKEVTPVDKIRMLTANGEVFDDAIIASFLKRQGGLPIFKLDGSHQIEFLAADSAKLDFSNDIYKVEFIDSNRVMLRSDVQLLKNQYSSVALQRELVPYKLNRYNRNLRVIPQTGLTKEIYRCELGDLGYWRNGEFILPAFNYRLNLYSRGGYFNGTFYGQYNLTFPTEILPRDTLVWQDLRVGFAK